MARAVLRGGSVRGQSPRSAQGGFRDGLQLVSRAPTLARAALGARRLHGEVITGAMLVCEKEPRLSILRASCYCFMCEGRFPDPCVASAGIIRRRIPA
ncbi:hypothetical protein NDU88_001122 [Pleurodeles waltl]|uniref:Uncharacterized protein n=1 Tax=Pleurodeles waltl TaxID=8319 RepID=A0AAV7R9V0_PLEWA|nr:hypothetical protein NDU88_001122 [Pleurodeles waltl]